MAKKKKKHVRIMARPGSKPNKMGIKEKPHSGLIG
jgi:hypothetical protein